MLGSVHCDEVRLSALGRCLSNAVCKIINIHQHQPTLISCTNTQTRLHQRMRKGKQKNDLSRYYSQTSQDRIDVNEPKFCLQV